MDIDVLEAKDPLLPATLKLRDGQQVDFSVPLWETQFRFDEIIMASQGAQGWDWLDEVIKVLYDYGVPPDALLLNDLKSRSAVYPFFTSFQVVAREARDSLKKKLNETPN